MGLDLMLRVEGTTKRNLSAFLKSLGFEPRQSIAPQRGCSYFYGFEKMDFRSTSGVEASLIPGSALPDTNEEDLVLAVHCKSWGSFYDVEKLNTVIRQVRKQFGGQVDGDYGKNRYIRPISRRIRRTCWGGTLGRSKVGFTFAMVAPFAFRTQMTF